MSKAVPKPDDWHLMTPIEKRLWKAGSKVKQVYTAPYYPGQSIGHSERYAWKTQRRVFTGQL